MKHFICALLSCLVLVTLARSEPTFEPQQIRVDRGNSSANTFVATDSTSTNYNEKVTLTAIKDLGPLGGSDSDTNLLITFSDPVEVSRAGSRAVWKSVVAIKAMPQAASLVRLAQLVFSDKSTQTARYTLMSRATNFNWSVTTGTKRAVSPPNQSFDITILTSGDNATNLRIDGNSLQETSTGYHIDPIWLRLSPVSSNHFAVISEGMRTTVAIEFSQAIPNGTYVGSINLAVDESAEAKGVEITLYRSRTGCRWFGVALILLGVLFAFLGSTVARNITAAADALMPATRLMALTAARRQKIFDCSPDLPKQVPQTLASLDDIDNELSPSQLRAMRFVPPWFASPFGVAQVATAAYATYLQERSNRLGSLGFLIDHGICPVAIEKFDPQNQGHTKARGQALNQLDNLAVNPNNGIPQMAQDIPPIIAAYKIALNPPPAPPPGTVAVASPPPASITDRPAMESLSFRLNLASGGAWALALVATVITGYGVLIASNLGFGVEMDFVKCFLWGLGVQIMGQQLSQLTPSSVSTSLGFKAPTT